MEYAIQLRIETEIESSQYETLGSMIQTLADEFQQGQLSAKRAVIHMMEATSLLPGVYCVQMLRNVLVSTSHKNLDSISPKA